MEDNDSKVTLLIPITKKTTQIEKYGSRKIQLTSNMAPIPFTITKLNKITREKPRKQLIPTNHHKVGGACV